MTCTQVRSVTPEQHRDAHAARVAALVAREDARRILRQRIFTSNGEEFPDADAAADAIGTTKERIRDALRLKHWHAGRKWSRGVPIVATGGRIAVLSDRGERWPTLAKAAADLGTSEPTIRRRIIDRALIAGRMLSGGPDYRQRIAVTNATVSDPGSIRAEYGCVHDERYTAN